MEAGGRGPGIADQIAKLLGQAPSVPKEEGVSKQGPQSNMPGTLTYSGALKAGAPPLPAMRQVEDNAGTTTVRGYDSGSKPPVDVLHQLITSKPALVAALTGIERDANGRITNTSLERIRDALDSQALTPQQVQQKAQQRFESFQQQMVARVASEAKLPPQAAAWDNSEATAAQRAAAAAAIRYQGLAAGQLTHHLVVQQVVAAEQAAARATVAAAAAAAVMGHPQVSPRSSDGSVVSQPAVNNKTEASMPQSGQPIASPKQPSSTTGKPTLGSLVANNPTAPATADQSDNSSTPSLPAHAGPVMCTAAIPVPERTVSPAVSSHDGSTPGSNSRMASMRNSLSLSVDVSQHTPSDISSESSGGSRHSSSEHDGAADEGSRRPSSSDSQDPVAGVQGNSDSLGESDRSASELDEHNHHLTLGSTEHLQRPWEESQRHNLDHGPASSTPRQEEAAAPVGISSLSSRNSSHQKNPSTTGHALHKRASSSSSSASEDADGVADDTEQLEAQQLQQLGQRVKRHQGHSRADVQGSTGQLQQQAHKKQPWGQRLSKRPPTPGVSLGKPISISDSGSVDSSSKGIASSMRRRTDGDKHVAAAAAEDRQKTWGHKLSKRPATPGVSLGLPISIFSGSAVPQQAESEAANRAATGNMKSVPAESQHMTRVSQSSDGSDAYAEHVVHFGEPGSSAAKQKTAAAARRYGQSAKEKQHQWGQKLSKRPSTPGVALGKPVSIFSDSGSSRASSQASRNEPEAGSEGADSDESAEHMVRFQPNPTAGKTAKQVKLSNTSSSKGKYGRRAQSAPGYSRVSAAALLEDAEGSHVRFNPALVQPGKTSARALAGAPACKHTEQQWGHKLTKKPPTPGVGLGMPVSIFSESGSNKQQQELPEVTHTSSDGGDSADLSAIADHQQVRFQTGDVAILDESALPSEAAEPAPAAPYVKKYGSKSTAAQEHRSEQKHQRLSKRAPTPGASLGKPISIFSSDGSSKGQQQVEEQEVHLAKHTRSSDAEGVAAEAKEAETAASLPSNKSPGTHVSTPQQPQHSKQPQHRKVSTPGTALGKPISIFSSDGGMEEHQPQASLLSTSDSGSPARRVSDSSHQQQPRTCRVSFSETGAAQVPEAHEQRVPAADSSAAGSSHQQQPRSRTEYLGTPEGMEAHEQNMPATEGPAAGGRHLQEPRTRKVSFSETGAEEIGPHDRHLPSISNACPSDGEVAAPAAAGTTQVQQPPLQSGASNTPTIGQLQPAIGEQPPNRRLGARSISIVVSEEPEQQASELDYHQHGEQQHSIAAEASSTAGGNSAMPGRSSGLQQALLQHNADLALEHQQQDGRRSLKAATTPGAAFIGTGSVFTDGLSPQQTLKSRVSPTVRSDAATGGSPFRAASLQQALLQHNPDLALEKQQQKEQMQQKSATTPGAGLGRAANIFREGSTQQQRQSCQGSLIPISTARAGSLQQALLQHNPDLALEKQQQHERKQLKAATTPGAGLGRAANIFKDSSPTQQKQSPQSSPAAASTIRAGSLQQALLQHNPSLALEKQQQHDRKQLKAATTPGAGLDRAASIFKDSSPTQQQQSPQSSPAALSTTRAGSLQQALLQRNSDLASEQQQQQERKQKKSVTTPGAGLGKPFNMFKDDSDDGGEQHSTGSPAASSRPISHRSRSSSLKEALLQHNPDLALEKQQQWERKQAKVPTTPGAGLGTAVSIFKDGGAVCSQVDQATSQPAAAASSPSRALRARSSSLKEALLQHNQDLALEQQQQWESKQAKVPTTPGAGLGTPFSIFKDESNDCNTSYSASPVQTPSPVRRHSGLSPAAAQAAVSPVRSGSSSRLGRSASSSSKDTPRRTQSPDMMAAAQHNAPTAGGLQHVVQHNTDGTPAGITDGDVSGSPGGKAMRSNSPLRTVTTAADAAYAAEQEENARRSPLRLSSTTLDPDPARLSPLGRSKSPLQAGASSKVANGTGSSSHRRRSADSTVPAPVASSSSNTARQSSYHELVVPVAVSVSNLSPASSTPGRTSPLQRSSAAAADESVAAAIAVTSPQQHSPSRLYQRSTADEVVSSSRLSRRSSADEVPLMMTRSPSLLSRNSASTTVAAPPPHPAEVDLTTSDRLQHDSAAAGLTKASPVRKESSSFSRLARSSFEA